MKCDGNDAYNSPTTIGSMRIEKHQNCKIKDDLM